MSDSRSPLLQAAAPKGLRALLSLRKTRRHHGRRTRRQSWFLWGAIAIAALVVVDSLYIAIRLPNWQRIATGPVPKSRFIEIYEDRRREDTRLPPLQWKPVSLSTIPTHVIRAVVVAEDSRFYQHSGFDGEAFQDAMETNLSNWRFKYGASTISQQTAKNLFFTPSRNPLRKWHELVFTFFMEKNLRKRRILEIYLNVAEFGQGIYGVDAAARSYFGKSIANVTEHEAIELAATLPAPANHNPKSRTRFFIRHSRTVSRHFYAAQGGTAEPAGVKPPLGRSSPSDSPEGFEPERSSILNELPAPNDSPNDTTIETESASDPSPPPDRPDDRPDASEPAR